MDWIVAFLLVAPAGVLYLQRSSWLIDYLVWVTVLNRGIRRVVDWSNDSFNVLSPISLTPLAISGLVFLLLVQNFSALPPFFQRISRFFAGALALAFAVGLVRNHLAAVYALAEYIAPLAIMGQAVLMGGNEKILDRWVRSIGWAAIAASAYGWYQYYTIPPWDAFWVRAVGFEGYLGNLKPTEMTVFSTMAERGPLAGFLGFAVIPMLVSKRWRNIGGWFSVLLILATMLLTFVRSSLITVVLAAIFFPLLNRGKNSFRILILLCVIALAATIGISKIPSAQKIGNRLQSISTITSDGSFQGRLKIIDHGLGATLRNPIGTGLGSTGLAGRVNTGELEAGAAIGDNGYFALLFSFGWVGAGLFFYGFYLIWKQVRIFERYGVRSETVMMFKALFFAGAIALIAGDWLAGPGAIVFFIFAGFAVYPRQAILAVRHARRRSAKPLRPSPDSVTSNRCELPSP